MIQSPCIRNCCLDDNDVCCGCSRHIDEITGWQTLTDDEKKIIIARCEKRKNNHTFYNQSQTNTDIE